jgi:hypothetical protein
MFILFGIIFNTIYIILNLLYFSKNKILPWYNYKVNVSNAKFYKYQFITALLLCIIIQAFTMLMDFMNLDSIYLVLVVLIFYICIYISKFIAYKKGYLSKIV